MIMESTYQKDQWTNDHTEVRRYSNIDVGIIDDGGDNSGRVNMVRRCSTATAALVLFMYIIVIVKDSSGFDRTSDELWRWRVDRSQAGWRLEAGARKTVVRLS
jgi:hypothetical protein